MKRSLSPSQDRFLGDLVVGKTVADIARSGGISRSTVCTQLERARRKLSAKTTIQAAVIYERRKRLAQRETKVDDVLLTDLARGRSAAEIAQERGLSTRAIFKAIRRQRERVGAKTNEQLVARYVAGIAELPVVGWVSTLIK